MDLIPLVHIKGGKWLLFKVFGGKWPLFTVFGGKWPLFTVFGGKWLLFTVDGGKLSRLNPAENLFFNLCAVEKKSFSETCSERENSAFQVKILISARYLP